MNKPKYDSFMADMYIYFGKATLPKIANDQYFKMLFSVPDSKADDLCREIISTFKYFPKIAELKEYTDRFTTEIKSYKNMQKCYYCMDKGTIRYHEKGCKPFVNAVYEMEAVCPKCNAGKEWAHLVQRGYLRYFNDVFNDESLEAVRRDNIQIYGMATEENTAQAKEMVSKFINTAGGAA